MPYATNDELPPSVRNHLPAHAQDIYREVFNHAWTTYAHSVRREEIAHRTAWAAVKRKFSKGLDGQWTASAGSAADFVT
jgi:cation transport regulator